MKRSDYLDLEIKFLKKLSIDCSMKNLQCEDTSIFAILKVPHMLGVLKLHRVHKKQTCKGNRSSTVPTALDTTVRGTIRLLASQERRHHEPGQVVVFNRRRHGSKHRHGAEVTSVGHKYRGKYVKTHLCDVLVHGVALYTHLWFDVHHVHDNNQVVTSLVKFWVMYGVAWDHSLLFCECKPITTKDITRISLCLHIVRELLH